MTQRFALQLTLIVLAFSQAVPAAAGAAAAPATALLAALQKGGYVLVMRHAQSPDAPPTAREAESDNGAQERQLSPKGKASARALGRALHELKIPIGQIYSSPTYRTRETVRLAGLGTPQLVPELGEAAAGMHATASQVQSSWLQQAVRQVPMLHTNTLIVTHLPNIAAAFGTAGSNLQAGEMLIFQPAANGARAIHRGALTIEQWQGLAAASR